MNKVISFSLWGNNPKYTFGAIKNAELSKTIYPDWVCRFYCGKSVPQDIVETLSTFDNVEIIKMLDEGDWTSMFWRFYACEDSDIMISRDTDSRVSIREKLAVDEWLKSNKDFHIMRDHPYHTALIMGGMWGCRNKILKNIKNLINEYVKGDFWQVDQNFLKDIIYNKVKESSFIHDSYFNLEKNTVKFPNNRMNNEFVGDVFDENENRDPKFYLEIY
jgi:hypothetical protein